MANLPTPEELKGRAHEHARKVADLKSRYPQVPIAPAHPAPMPESLKR